MTMNVVLFDDIPVSLDTANIAKRFKVDEDSSYYIELCDMIDEAVKVAKPKAVYTTAMVELSGEKKIKIDDIEFTSRVMENNFKNVHRAFPYIATCGIEAKDWSDGYDDPLLSYWADSIKNLFLGHAMAYLNKHMKDDLKLGKLSAMNPGSLPDWPLHNQVGLFDVIGDVKGLVGVTLTESMLMVPTKSVSGIFFETESGYANCQLCTLMDCPNRKAKFDQELYDTIMKK